MTRSKELLEHYAQIDELMPSDLAVLGELVTSRARRLVHEHGIRRAKDEALRKWDNYKSKVVFSRSKEDFVKERLHEDKELINKQMIPKRPPTGVSMDTDLLDDNIPPQQTSTPEATPAASSNTNTDIVACFPCDDNDVDKKVSPEPNFWRNMNSFESDERFPNHEAGKMDDGDSLATKDFDWKRDNGPPELPLRDISKSRMERIAEIYGEPKVPVATAVTESNEEIFQTKNLVPEKNIAPQFKSGKEFDVD